MKSILLTGSLLAVACSGCALPEMLFSVLGDHYSGGGTTQIEKKYHFDRQIEKYEAYEKYGATPSD